MGSPAKLPGEDVQDQLEDAISAAQELTEILDELLNDEAWKIWNLGGVPFGRPEFKGPGHYTADEFASFAHHIHGRLEKVAESFEHRKTKEAEREARR